MPDMTPNHAGYASGSVILNDATWRAAVVRLLAASKEIEEQTKDGTIKRSVHETDPSPEGRWTRRQKRPGSLPLLVEVKEIAEDAKVVDHACSILDPGTDLDLTCYHHARHFVSEARRINASGMALLPLKLEDGLTVIRAKFVLA